jgi:hypothetical protein
MKPWNSDTFASAQQPRTYVVNRMVVSREHMATAAPYQEQAPTPAQPQRPARIPERHPDPQPTVIYYRSRQLNIELDFMQQEANRIRAGLR